MYILKCSFAQPSGIAVGPHGSNENEKNIYIADSESSSIRFINSSGRVAGLVGGSKDPSVCPFPSQSVYLFISFPFHLLSHSPHFHTSSQLNIHSDEVLSILPGLCRIAFLQKKT